MAGPVRLNPIQLDRALALPLKTKSFRSTRQLAKPVGICEAVRRVADQPEGSGLPEAQDPDRVNRPGRHSDFEARTEAVVGGAEIGVALTDLEFARIGVVR